MYSAYGGPMSSTPRPSQGETSSLTQHWRQDALSGFLVFLIALPLCLGISVASGFPPIAGVITAVVGAIVTLFVGGAPLAIKGPAAGLIAIVLGAVNDLGGGDPAVGYHRALAVIVVAGVIQIVLAVAKAGVMGDFFPSAVVHGMLAAIGVLIFSRQSYGMLGVAPPVGGPLDLLRQLPSSVMHLNPAIATIGAVSMAILFGLPKLPWAFAKRVPAPLVVAVVAVALGIWFDLGHEHHYQFRSHDHIVGPRFLVRIPGNIFRAITLPDFSQITSLESMKYIVMFSLVGSIESLLSARAVDTLDPWKRRADLNRDLLAVGIGNTLAGLIGGLPMISEIVRSSANINNGARTRLANTFHGVFLLVSVSAVPWLLQKIPTAALAAMLVYTGIRLASPQEFARTWKIGIDQMFVFAMTLVLTLATDLLVGVIAGVVIHFGVNFVAGSSLAGMFSPHIAVTTQDTETTLVIESSALFSNYISIKRVMDDVPLQHKLVLDFSHTSLVDHTVMERLHELALDRVGEGGGTITITGLERHVSWSDHPLAGRRKPEITHA
jgi:MFS superfamily sulfate permease-like transporter